jgi:hypothetical protein
MAKYLAQNRFFVLKVGNLLFAHGAVVPKIVDKYTIPEINRMGREYLNGTLKWNMQLKEVLESDASSILWSRAFSGQRPSCEKLDYVLNKWGCKHLLVGHTPQPNGITSDCNHRVWRVDVGMSRAFGSKGVIDRVQVLEIKRLARNKCIFTPLRFSASEIAAASMHKAPTKPASLVAKPAKTVAPKAAATKAAATKAAVRLVPGRPIASHKPAMSQPRAFDASQGAYARV